MALSSIDVSTILTLPIHESMAYLSICLGLFQILSSESYSFQYRSFTFLIKFIPKYFIVFDVIVNGIVFFVSLLTVVVSV